MTKVAFICAQCGGPGLREKGDYNRKMAAGAPLHCSRQCAWAAMAKRSADSAAERTRPCETCGALFTPRARQLRNGQGRFCSQKCNRALHEAGQRPEVWEARIATIRAKRAAGEWKVLSGPDNPKWRGGKDAMMRRLSESGLLAERVRDYRRRNPDKVREFQRRRAGRKVGRLPYGTIPRIRALQKNRCAICRGSLRNGDHLDHILPLAKGGKHEPSNLQLLCPPCNLHKSDRDPVEHMQSLGRLL